MVKLKEYIHQIRGVSYKPADSSDKPKEGYIPLLRANNINNGKINFENLIYVKNEKVKEVQYLKKGDILICTSSGSKELVGKAGLIRENVNATFGAFCKVIRLKECCNYNYFNHYFQSNYYKSMIQNSSNGANINNLKTENFDNLNVNMVNYDIQTIIANKLDKIQETIDIRKKQIEKLDELIKSKFVERFGEPLNNTKWNLKRMKDISETITDGSTVDTKYYDKNGDVLFLRIQNVWKNEFKLEDSVFISDDTNKKYLDTSLKNGDVLITKIGRFYTKDSSLGRVAIYKGMDNKANYSNNIMRIRLKENINSEFINILLNLEDYQKYIKRVSKGGTDKRALSKKLIEEFPIILPPIELQNQFAKFVNEVNKQEIKLQKNLEEMQKLQESLMNKYFN